jgi:cobalt/nickel transport system permease protein
VSALPLPAFAALLLPIHLPIALVEGVATAAVLAFLRRARPEALDSAAPVPPAMGWSMRRLAVSVGVAALGTAVGLSAVASGAPDGLEWSIAKLSPASELESPAGRVHAVLARVQRHTALLPDYAWRAATSRHDPSDPVEQVASPAVQSSMAGLVGSGLTLALVGVLGLGLRRRRARPAHGSELPS